MLPAALGDTRDWAGRAGNEPTRPLSPLGTIGYRAPVIESTITFRAGRAGLGAAIALAAHVLVFVAAYLAPRLVGAEGTDMQDLAAVVGTIVLGQGLVALACLIVGIVLVVRGRRDLGAGLLLGWLVGGLLIWFVVLGVRLF